MCNFVKVVTDKQERHFYKRSSINAGKIISVHISRYFLFGCNNTRREYIYFCYDQMKVNLILIYHNVHVHENHTICYS